MKNKLTLALIIILGLVILGLAILSDKESPVTGNVINTESENIEGMQKETITIGAMFPLTGSMGFLGEGMKNSMLLAQEQLPKDTKYNYEIIFEDDKMDNKAAATAANKFISVDQVDAMVTATSGPGNVVAPLAQDNKKVHIGFASDQNVAKGEYNFIHWTTPQEETRVFIEELQRRGIKKIAVLSLNQQGIQASLTDLQEKLKNTDIEIVHEEKFNFGDKDFKTAIVKAERKNPEVYLLLSFSPELELMAKQIKEAGITKPITAIESFEFTEQPELFEGQWYVNAADSTDKFINEYKTKYGKNPATASANAYDAFNLIVQAYETAGTSSNDKPTSLEVANALSQIKNYPGALGELNVDQDGVIQSIAVVREVKNGEFVTIRS